MSRSYPDKPLVGVGAIIVKGEELLLVRRGRQPARGLWSIPGGRVEIGETLAQALQREIAEECGISIIVGPPVAVLDSIYIDAEGRVKYHYVLVDFWAEYAAGELHPASDVLEARWVPLKEVSGYTLTAGTLELITELSLLSPEPCVKPSGIFYRTIKRSNL